ncbi:MAG: hypothetical protein RR052_04470 [Oscillospiraceae bacterium]
MQLIKQEVSHPTFGKGIITEFTENIITISFSECEKRFIYPCAFETFLTLKDSELQKEINKTIKKENDIKQTKKQLIQGKQQQIQKIKNLKITPNSQAVFDIKSECKDEVFSSWEVSTGVHLSGNSKGQPRIPVRLKPNTACILTECKAGMPEESRRIIGAFMVKESFFGEMCKEGIIEGHDRFKIELSDDKSLLFWDYFPKTTKLQRWGNNSFKYFANADVQHILCDIKKAFSEDKQKDTIDEFYQYFCIINRLSEKI